MGLVNTMQNDSNFMHSQTTFTKKMVQLIDALREKDTKVSSYDNDEIIKRLAKIMNYRALLDEMEAMKDLEKTEDLEDKLRGITIAGNRMELSEKDLDETKKIFCELANDPEKREQPITEAIIREAYGRYYKKNEIEPASMSLENFDKYLYSLSELSNSDAYKDFEKFADSKEYQEYEKKYFEKYKEFSIVKDLKEGKMKAFLSGVDKIRKAILDNPVALFYKDKKGEIINNLYSYILPDLKDSTLQKLKNRDFSIPDEFRGCINIVCGNFEQWLKEFDKNVELTRTFVKGKIETNTVGEFEQYRKKLEKSLTRKNSDEYNNIIKMVELVNKKEKFDQFSNYNLTDKQHYALKLLAVKNSINKYIAHKAEHGVNKNVGGKLAAVEELNVEVTKRLSSLKLPAFQVGDKTYDISKYAITEEQEFKVAEKVNPAAARPYDPQDRAGGTKNLNDDCMKRIILKAIEKNYSSQIPKLERARHLFERNEGPQAPQAEGAKKL